MAPARERVLITGGSGFVGSCLARHLIAKGHDVHLVLRPQSDRWRLADLEGHYRPHLADLRDAPAICAAVAAARPDVIFHAAAHGTLPTQKERAAVLASNLLGTANLLDALDGFDYRALVHLGSSSEYGHKPGAMDEEDRLEPRSDYAVAKAAATLLCLAEAHKGRRVVAVRIFSAYGPWEDPSRIASYVMGCCLRGERPQVTAGRQPRDWVFIDDVVELIRLAADSPAARGRILHAGTGTDQTVRDLIEAVLEVCAPGRWSAEYGAQPPRPDEPARWVASIAETTRLTGWRPRHDLRSGARLMWQWYSARRAA
jgi:nucleoside-diphosphate-sugar epimerase